MLDSDARLAVAKVEAVALDRLVEVEIPAAGDTAPVPARCNFVVSVTLAGEARRTGHAVGLVKSESGNFGPRARDLLEAVCRLLPERGLALENGLPPSFGSFARAVSDGLPPEAEPQPMQGDFLGALKRLVRRAVRRPQAREEAQAEILRTVHAALIRALAGGTPLPLLGPAADGAQPPADDVSARFHATLIDACRAYWQFPLLPVPTRAGMVANVYTDAASMQPLGNADPKSHLLEREALALGLTTRRLSRSAFVAEDAAGRQIPFKLSRSPVCSGVALALASHKDATRIYLADRGLPVPKGRMFRAGDLETARAYAERIGYPVVVKPATGVRGIGVVPGIRDRAELDRAFRVLRQSKLGHDDFIVEKHVAGFDYRLMVIGDRVVAATLRAPASVVGDGERSVGALILHKNAIRALNPHLRSRPIPWTEALRFQLERAGLTLASVPEAGQRVQLSGSCNLSQGGDSVNVLEEVHPSILETAVRAVRAIPGFGYCGVDFLLEDHRKPIDAQDAGICELNAHAAVGTARYPMFGAPANVPLEAVRAVAEWGGLALRATPAAHLRVKLAVRGKVTGVGYRRWFARHAQASGLNGWVANADRRTVQAVLEGETVAVSALVTAAIAGPQAAQPTSVEAVPLEAGERFDGFAIRARPGRA
jgi:D-alanine-D-alanine ligase-like ATP-grasp enzyme/acylphosphatase